MVGLEGAHGNLCIPGPVHGPLVDIGRPDDDVLQAQHTSPGMQNLQPGTQEELNGTKNGVLKRYICGLHSRRGQPIPRQWQISARFAMFHQIYLANLFWQKVRGGNNCSGMGDASSIVMSSLLLPSFGECCRLVDNAVMRKTPTKQL